MVPSPTYPDPQAAASSISPSPASAPPPPSRGPGQQEYSCILCKQRKVRCDRANPCSGCVRAGVVCEPGVRQPYKRRKRNGASRDLDVASATRDAEPASRALASRPMTRALQEEGRAERPQLPTFGQYVPLHPFSPFHVVSWRDWESSRHPRIQAVLFSCVPTSVNMSSRPMH